jgi:hypothetical protein
MPAAIWPRSAREAYGREGRTILTRRPPVHGQDWNDVLVASTMAAA